VGSSNNLFHDKEKNEYSEPQSFKILFVKMGPLSWRPSFEF